MAPMTAEADLTVVHGEVVGATGDKVEARCPGRWRPTGRGGRCCIECNIAPVRVRSSIREPSDLDFHALATAEGVKWSEG